MKIEKKKENRLILQPAPRETTRSLTRLPQQRSSFFSLLLFVCLFSLLLQLDTWQPYIDKPVTWTISKHEKTKIGFVKDHTSLVLPVTLYFQINLWNEMWT